ncbi:MAG: hypothetical protein M0Z53_15800 [Thermaerobacter sp.]|nr:hypothetical protein [Thermaerobacter sp.]
MSVGSPPRPAASPVASIQTVMVPKIRWYPATLGPEVLLNEGVQISSVLAGPAGRIYYGTSNPLADTNIIGWLSPATGQNAWRAVPAVVPPFPSATSQHGLNLTQSAYWDAVDLIIAGSHNVWYRHWGYVGGWSASGRFVPGDYTIPGPTVHRGTWTAAVHTTFSGQSDVRLMNLTTRLSLVYPLPDSQPVQALAFSGTGKPTLWLMTETGLWRLAGNGTWTLLASLPSGDFFVSLGHWSQSLWIIDANGQVGVVGTAGIEWRNTLPLSPLEAVTAGNNGLWVVSPRHLSLWVPGRRLQSWLWPKDPYPAPASTWPTNGANTPPDWPPIPHISSGPNGTLDMGYGTWIGQASLTWRRQPRTQESG